jgi:FkbM family methyltransferase
MIGATPRLVNEAFRSMDWTPLRRAALRCVLRRYPFYSGYFVLLEKPLIRALGPKGRPGEVATTRTRDGLRMLVRVDDLDGYCIDLLGDCDPRITWICRRLLRPGDVFLDIGANYGRYGLVAARAVGPTGRVLAFEPQPALAEMIRQSAAMNGLTNLAVHEVALSNEDGALALNIPSDHTGAASLSRETRGFGAVAQVEVPVRRGASYLAGCGVDRVRMIKLDVEGHEPEALEGLDPLFRSHPPDAVVFESNEWIENHVPHHQWPFADLATVRFFREHDYLFYGIGRSYWHVNLFPIDPQAPTHPPVMDLLVVPRERWDEVAPRLRLPEPERAKTVNPL